MPNHVTHTSLMVSPAQAREWLLHAAFQGQRHVRAHHVQRLKNIMHRGAFRPGTPISFAIINGQKLLINGQHTLHALIQANITLRLTVEEYRCASMEEAGRLYATFDVQLKRTAMDIYTANAFADTYGLSKQAISSLSASIPILLGGFLPATRGKDHPVNIYFSDIEARQAAMIAWAEIAATYYNTFIGDVSKYHAQQGQRANVAAIGLLTCRYQPAKASTFWRQIARREDLHASMPAYTLSRFLDDSSGMDRRTGYQYARYVASAWNAFYRSRTISKLRYRSPALPIEIAGTPFTGKDFVSYFYEGMPHFEPRILPQETDSSCKEVGNPL